MDDRSLLSRLRSYVDRFKTRTQAAAQNVSRLLLLAGMILVSLNLRPAVVSVSPLLELIRADLELSYAVVSLLTTIPIFCMGTFALVAPAVTRHIGRESGVLWSVVLIGVATVARLAGHNAVILLATTVLVGIGIAVTQALLPPIVKVYYPDRAAFATGVYTASLTIGATLASGVTVPVQQFFGSWTVALASWTVLVVIAGPVWYLFVRQTRRTTVTERTSESSPSDSTSLPWRSPFAWAITLFFAINSSLYYSLITWLAPRYVALGWVEGRASLLLTVFILSGLVGMLSITFFGDRTTDRRLWIVPLMSLVLIGCVGVAFVPESFPWVWGAMLGTGISGMFTVSLVLPVDFAADERTSDTLSSMVLGAGYMIAALVPFLIGGLRDQVGNFTSAFLGIVVLSILGFAVSLLFSPRRDPIEV